MLGITGEEDEQPARRSAAKAISGGKFHSSKDTRDPQRSIMAMAMRIMRT